MIFCATAEAGAAELVPLVDRAKSEVAALRSLPGAAALQVGYAGDVAIAVEELSALESDVVVSALLVLVGVVLSILLAFRTPRALPALALPLVDRHGVGLRGGVAVCLVAREQHRVPGFNRHRQRHQPRDHPARPLPRGAPPRYAGGLRRRRRHEHHLARHPGRRCRGRGGLRVVGHHQFSRLQRVRRDRVIRGAHLLGRDLPVPAALPPSRRPRARCRRRKRPRLGALRRRSHRPSRRRDRHPKRGPHARGLAGVDRRGGDLRDAPGRQPDRIRHVQAAKPRVAPHGRGLLGPADGRVARPQLHRGGVHDRQRGAGTRGGRRARPGREEGSAVVRQLAAGHPRRPDPARRRPPSASSWPASRGC